MAHDFFVIILSWFLFSLTALVSAPLVVKFFGKVFPDAGWAFTRTLGWLAVAIPIWFLAHVGIGINTTGGTWMVLLVLLALNAWYFKKHQTTIINRLKTAKTLILAEEALFFFGLLFLSYIRGLQPDINGLEKFMDVGLMNSYLHSPTLPIADMWLAGHTFNYYTFGHFLGAIAKQIMRQPIEMSYNLLLAVVMGLMLTQTFGLVTAFVSKRLTLLRKVVVGVLGAALVVFGGNSQPLWYLLTNHSFKGYWYPDATRFIPFTIHEFPAYSFIVSDLHAHVWSMVLVLVLVAILYLWMRLIHTGKAVTLKFSDQNPLVYAVAIGFLLGIIASTSTWDTLIYGMCLGIIGIALLIVHRLSVLKPLLISAVAVGISAMLAASPWFLTFTSISEGARLVTERSELWRFLALWATHLIVTAAAVLTIGLTLYQKRRQIKSRELFIIILVVTSWILLLLPELFYMKDIYPSHPRANTMFKLTFQAFILMNIVFAWLVGAVQVRIEKPVLKKVAATILFIVSGILLIYPYFGYRDYYNLKLHQYRGLNGLTWLELSNPNDYAAIEWLRTSVSGRPVVLEAVGESYTTFARVSTFTSFPTVLGWRVHEWLWRGSFDIPGQRTGEVQAIYEQPLSELAQTKLREYNVSYIFVGDKEREAYPNIDEVNLKQLGKIVFLQGSTYIIQVQEPVALQSRVQ